MLTLLHTLIASGFCPCGPGFAHFFWVCKQGTINLDAFTRFKRPIRCDGFAPNTQF